MQKGGKENGSACRVGHNASETTPGSSSLMAVLLSVIVVRPQRLMTVSIVSAGELVGKNYAAAAATAVVDAVASAELVSRTRVRRSHLATQTVVTSLPKVMNSAKEG